MLLIVLRHSSNMLVAQIHFGRTAANVLSMSVSDLTTDTRDIYVLAVLI